MAAAATMAAAVAAAAVVVEAVAVAAAVTTAAAAALRSSAPPDEMRKRTHTCVGPPAGERVRGGGIASPNSPRCGSSRRRPAPCMCQRDPPLPAARGSCGSAGGSRGEVSPTARAACYGAAPSSLLRAPA
eukprot:183155-Prymnesium_polylepis.3